MRSSPIRASKTVITDAPAEMVRGKLEAQASGPMLVSVRVPKSGSASLTAMLRQGFSGRGVHFLPDTLPGDAAFSLFQRYRAKRSMLRNLWKHHRALSLKSAYARITETARPGDLIAGGHIDFPSARSNIPLPLRLITILRDPAARVLSEYNYGRERYYNKSRLHRFDTGVLHQVAGRSSFDGYLDFLSAHSHLYGNLAARYLGWNGEERLALFFRRNVFHAGVLENPASFADGLSEKLGCAFTFPHTNRTGRLAIDRITKAQHTRIEALYPLDFALHAYVRDRA